MKKKLAILLTTVLVFGMTLTGCGNDGGDFMSHKLEHEMGGMFDVTHGAGLAAVWPSWASLWRCTTYR